MSLWIGIAASAVIAVSLLMGLILGRVLGAIGRETCDLLEAAPQAQALVSLPPERGRQAETARSQRRDLVTS